MIKKWVSRKLHHENLEHGIFRLRQVKKVSETTTTSSSSFRILIKTLIKHLNAGQAENDVQERCVKRT